MDCCCPVPHWAWDAVRFSGGKSNGLAGRLRNRGDHSRNRDRMVVLPRSSATIALGYFVAHLQDLPTLTLVSIAAVRTFGFGSAAAVRGRLAAARSESLNRASGPRASSARCPSLAIAAHLRSSR